MKINSENFKTETQSESVVMSKFSQNLVVFMEQNKNASNTSTKAVNMCLNRFCIDEDAAFELSELNYLNKSSYDIVRRKYLGKQVKVKGKKN